MSTTSETAGDFKASALSTSLTVNDLQKSIVWYRDVLGFAVDETREREGKVVAAALRAGDVRFMINQDDGAKGWERVKGEGFSLHFTTWQNIDAIAERAKAAGATLTREPADMPWGARVFTLNDPTGYKLVVSSPKK